MLVYGLNFAPELTGIGRYTGDMCAWLVEQGYDVTAVTSFPYYPHWRLQQGYPVWRWSHEKWNGVSVIRCPLWVPRQPTTMKRILHLMSFSLLSGPVAVLAALWLRPEIVFTVEPATFGTPWALLAAKLTGARSWLHVQDIEMGAAESVGLLDSQNRLGGLVRRLYGRMLCSFDQVTTLSGRMRQKLAEYGRAEAAIDLFPNWVDTEKFKPVDASRMRAELGLTGGDICVLYAGNLGEKQGGRNSPGRRAIAGRRNSDQAGDLWLRCSARPNRATSPRSYERHAS
jgi:colanic acid biosynthesis glycosyl transferase WcaI